MKKNSSTDEGEPTFESALKDLETTVQSLEQGNLSLEQTLLEYEKAVGRVRFCRDQIETAERRIEILRGIDKEGKIKTETFEEGAENLEEKQASRTKRRSV